MVLHLEHLHGGLLSLHLGLQLQLLTPQLHQLSFLLCILLLDVLQLLVHCFDVAALDRHLRQRLFVRFRVVRDFLLVILRNIIFLVDVLKT